MRSHWRSPSTPQFSPEVWKPLWTTGAHRVPCRAPSTAALAFPFRSPRRHEAGSRCTQNTGSAGSRAVRAGTFRSAVAPARKPRLQPASLRSAALASSNQTSNARPISASVLAAQASRTAWSASRLVASKPSRSIHSLPLLNR